MELIINQDELKEIILKYLHSSEDFSFYRSFELKDLKFYKTNTEQIELEIIIKGD